MQPISPRVLLGLVFLLFTNAECFSQSGVLSSPTRSGDQFQFNLEGDPYRRYVIQGSSNLVDWDLLMISFSSGTVHPLSFAASNDFSFFRTMLYSRPNSLSRAIQLTGSMDLRGNVFAADSFNSTNQAFSTNGRYDVSKRSDRTELCLDEGLTTVGYVGIWGSIEIGPGAPLVIGPNGAVGNLAWHANGNKGIQPGKLSTSLNPCFPENELPFTTALAPITVQGVKTLQNGDYALEVLTGKTLVVGNARLYVSRSISLNGEDYITIQTNASLRLYVGATNSLIGGMGIVHESGNATHFIYYGLPGNTNLSLPGNANFTGIIYAPQATILLGGGGSGTRDFVGAIVARALQFNGHWNYHYDEALRELPFP